MNHPPLQMLWTTPIARRLLIAAAVASTAPRSAISTDVGACLAWRGECIAFANERAPALDTPLGGLNMAARQCTLSDLLQRGKYVLLWAESRLDERVQARREHGHRA